MPQRNKPRNSKKNPAPEIEIATPYANPDHNHNHVPNPHPELGANTPSIVGPATPPLASTELDTKYKPDQNTTTRSAPVLRQEKTESKSILAHPHQLLIPVRISIPVRLLSPVPTTKIPKTQQETIIGTTPAFFLPTDPPTQYYDKPLQYFHGHHAGFFRCIRNNS